jgi:hypothetical protein
MRVVVLTDIEADPDDTQSLIRMRAGVKVYIICTFVYNYSLAGRVKTPTLLS